jgi:hypothetical protein
VSRARLTLFLTLFFIPPKQVKFGLLFFNLFYLKTPFNPAKISRESLQQFRHVTDPLADQVITGIIESGHAKQINS